MTRLAVVVTLVLLLVLARVLYDRWRRLAQEPVPPARLPSWLVEGSDRTWVVFTTPYCASCGPLTDRLRAYDPSARVVTVDATRHRGLADDFSVRTSPTVVLGDSQGQVQLRLVGAAAVREMLDGATQGQVRRPA
ncbi:MAG: thioredoxin family protein [Actinomycetota bacterium]|nr:thioredoxin family protein [Actinomycetota bacterium]